MLTRGRAQLRAQGRALTLPAPWVLWAHRRGGGAYSENAVRVGRAATIAEFWALFNAVQRPSAFFGGVGEGRGGGKRRRGAESAYEAISVFADGAPPMWESHRGGGELFVRVRVPLARLDDMWERAVLACVGGELQLQPQPQARVLGVRVADRTGGRDPAYRLELWFGAGGTDVEKAALRRALERLVFRDAPWEQRAFARPEPRRARRRRPFRRPANAKSRRPSPKR